MGFVIKTSPSAGFPKAPRADAADKPSSAVKTAPSTQVGKAGKGQAGGANGTGKTAGVHANGKGNALKPATTQPGAGVKRPALVNANGTKR